MSPVEQVEALQREATRALALLRKAHSVSLMGGTTNSAVRTNIAEAASVLYKLITDVSVASQETYYFLDRLEDRLRGGNVLTIQDGKCVFLSSDGHPSLSADNVRRLMVDMVLTDC